jgi:hypothetical protein
MKREKVFLTELRDSFVKYDAFFHKISDSFHGPGSAMRFDIPKPFDVFVAFQGTPMAIEAKVLRKYEAFGVRHLRDCQQEGLDSFARHGTSWVFLNIRHSGDKMNNIKRINRLLIFNWEWLKKEGTVKKVDLLEWPFIDKAGGVFPLGDWLMG